MRRFYLILAIYLTGVPLTYGYAVNRPATSSYTNCLPCIDIDAKFYAMGWPIFWLGHFAASWLKP